MAGENIITLTLNADTDEVRRLKWEQNPEHGEWVAWMTYPDPEKSYRLYDLDCVTLKAVLALIQQELTIGIADIYLTPRTKTLGR